MFKLLNILINSTNSVYDKFVVKQISFQDVICEMMKHISGNNMYYNVHNFNFNT